MEAFLGGFPVLVGLEKGAFFVAVGFEAGFPEVGEEFVCVLGVGEPALDIGQIKNKMMECYRLTEPAA